MRFMMLMIPKGYEKAKQEAFEWASRCPASDNEIIEIRQVQEFDDFPEDIQKAAASYPTLKSQSP